MRLGFVPPIPMLEELLALVIRTPSMMYSGSLLRERLFVPRMRTRAPAPVRFPCSTSRPGALAASRSFMLPIVPVCSRLSALTVLVTLGTSRFACSPVAVTTTSSSE